MTIRATVRAGALLVALSSCALADLLTITFSSSLLTANRGQTVTFAATIANPTAAPVFLNGDDLNVAAPLTIDDTKFFLNTPLFLSAGQSVTVPVFDITAPLSTPPGLYPGIFTILGGLSANDLLNVGSAPFAVVVTPEPQSLLLLITGTIAALLRRRRH